MKKILLFLVLTSLNLVAQTPIWHFNFNTSGYAVDSQGNLGNQLTTLAGNLTDSPNFGMDRFGNIQQSLICNATYDNLKYEVNLTNLPQGTAVRTISYWVRYKNTQEQHVFKYGGNSQYNIFGFYDDGSGNAPYSYITTGNLQASTFTHTNAPNYISLNTSDSDAWYHYVIVVDAGAMVSIYRNGVLLGTNGMAATLNTIGNTLKFGVYDMTINTTTGGYFLLDDFKIYDVALTESQIKQKYADEMAFDATDLVAYYGFENNLDCSNNSTHNLTANVPIENTYEAGVLGQSRKITNNPLFSNTIATAIETGDFTIMYWDKQNVNQADGGSDYPTSVELGGSLYARKRQGTFKTGYAANATTWIGEGSTAVQPISVWTHHTLIGKMIGSSFNIVYYRNGELRSVTANNTSSTSVHTFLDKLVFGGGLSGGTISSAKNIQNANLDEIYVYNRVLSQPEILALMYRTTLPAVLSNSNFELKEISLYPNPTNSMFIVEVPNDSVKTISVIDVMGKVVVTSNVSTVDVTNLASGIYIVKVETTSGKTGTQKLVKN